MRETGNGRRVMIVEDDAVLSRLIGRSLEQLGFVTAIAPSWAMAQQALSGASPALAILDVNLPDARGIDCIEVLSEHCPVIVLTAYGTIHEAVNAMRMGAVEYLTKPFDPEKLEIAIDRALEHVSLKRSLEFTRSKLNPSIAHSMVGRSAAFVAMLHEIEQVADTGCTVLIDGESGVGKELVAQSVHQLSGRATQNFVPVDCSTLQENLFESEVFGHERGAFTGADRRKDGLIEVAEGGTVFFDEIGELGAGLQAKMLRLIETGRYRRLGGTADLGADARFVAATNRDLKSFSEAGKFRRDLYFRLAAFVIHVPPLRNRTDDIPLLAEHFLENRAFLRQVHKRFNAGALAALVAHDWPGNVRELRNVVERAIIVSGNAREITARHLSLETGTPGSLPHTDFWRDEPTLEELKRDYLVHLMEKHDGHRGRVAAILGISERNTYRLIKRYEINC
ncbi:MAG: sigma-54-dependent Fis family transcriptional regulator [Geminicoccaceae bacterium]|nr:sigma-54-dependent Fis family transcriptional regulator [Geminicoccaceae bacterium]